MHSDLAIAVHDLGKTHRVFRHPGDRVRQALTLGTKKFHHEFRALHGVSFEVRKGETVGVIGRNGSGKSTLLQLVCGIMKPTAGRVETRGKISALLELGAGFNPELTGTENVYFYGAMMGMPTRFMDERFQDIADFADIGEFIDQPVRTYSSGMFVRLAFAAAVAVDPELLVVDEALSVGDLAFQQRCVDRMQELRDRGVTVLLVSHDMQLTRTFCDRLVYLEAGRVKQIGDPEEVGEAYVRDATRVVAHGHGNQHRDHDPLRSSIGGVRVEHIDQTVRIHVHGYLSAQAPEPVEIVVQLRDARGYILYGRHARGEDVWVRAESSGRTVVAVLEVNAGLLLGEYAISVSLNVLDTAGHACVLDKQVGIATLDAPGSVPGSHHGAVNLRARWRPDLVSTREQEAAP